MDSDFANFELAIDGKLKAKVLSLLTIVKLKRSLVCPTTEKEALVNDAKANNETAKKLDPDSANVKTFEALLPAAPGS